jgi:DNA-binding Lrp family transcriptional regulator
MLAYVQIAADPDRESKILDSLRKMAQVKESYIVFGEWDILAKVETTNPEELGSFVVAKIRPLSGIKNTKTLIVAK